MLLQVPDALIELSALYFGLIMYEFSAKDKNNNRINKNQALTFSVQLMLHKVKSIYSSLQNPLNNFTKLY